ncbi:MAG TPA: 50S ribosomal protein L25 [Terriglobales bacterium]|nr:50S ribosomal protein L25 [Terriglobales bacterium]
MATAATGSITVQAKPRQPGTKNAARRVRKAGMVPATVYGAGKAPVSVSLDPKQIAQILHSKSGHNTIFELQMDGDNAMAMIVDWQNEPIKGALLHVDVKRIAMDKKLTVNVPIVLVGEAFGVKTEGGILEQVLREIEIECLPSDIPDTIEVNVSELRSGQNLRVKDLPHSGNIDFLTEEDEVVAHIVHVKEVAETSPEAAGAEAAAGAAEPEVIKKGKQETEEEGEKKK